MNQQLINSVAIAFLSAGLAWIANRYWYQRAAITKEAERLAAATLREAEELKAERKVLMGRVSKLEEELNSVKHTVQPITSAFQDFLVKKLTHFHTPEMDALMKKLGPPVTLEANEMARLEELLILRTNDLNGRISATERDAAVMLPMVIKLVKAEVEADDPVKIKVVSTPVKAEKVEKEGHV